MSGGGLLLRLLAAWLPMAALWILIGISVPGGELTSAVRYGLVSIGVAGLLGQRVWVLTARVPWPDRVGVSFYLLQAGIGTSYALVWMYVSVKTIEWLAGFPLQPLQWPLDVFLTFWRFLTGLLLYGLTAGVCYAMRTREQLRQQERATLAARTLAAESRLDALRAQLNPHFLFNALHSVSELMHDDVDAAERALENLAGLLRASLDSEGDGLVTLADERDLVDGYLAIERLRHSDRLRVGIRFADDALSARLPGFTLQVLVENAVRHAVATRPEGGQVEIRAGVRDGRLRVEVVDDGPGFAAGAPSPGNGRGLDLLRQRLEAEYDGQGRLTIEPAEGGGSRVAVEIPADPSSARPAHVTAAGARQTVRP